MSRYRDAVPSDSRVENPEALLAELEERGIVIERVELDGRMKLLVTIREDILARIQAHKHALHDHFRALAEAAHSPMPKEIH